MIRMWIKLAGHPSGPVAPEGKWYYWQPLLWRWRIKLWKKLRSGTLQSFLRVKSLPCCVFKSMQSKATRESENMESLGAESLTLLDRCVFVFVSGRLCLWAPLKKERNESHTPHFLPRATLTNQIFPSLPFSYCFIYHRTVRRRICSRAVFRLWAVTI